MTKYFCDKCGKEITFNQIFTLKVGYECPKGNRPTYPQGFRYELCEDCITQEIKHVRTIQKEIKEG